ncbi:hypothetical protein B0T20DRAFT_392534 [Sordaria brevicollis]|uniref:Uncharacterized protein n=1 Tax=Sordaria brevicollis TaxID=83679 RepID=A0AAE0UCY1_SORBR|nr:hypothetical protein B0T20DRAFT_392534 [Sordaria brevicollis]
MCKQSTTHRFCTNGPRCLGGYGLFASPPRRWYSRQYVRRYCSDLNCGGTDLKVDGRLSTYVEDGECLECRVGQRKEGREEGGEEQKEEEEKREEERGEERGEVGVVKERGEVVEVEQVEQNEQPGVSLVKEQKELPGVVKETRIVVEIPTEHYERPQKLPPVIDLTGDAIEKSLEEFDEELDEELEKFEREREREQQRQCEGQGTSTSKDQE